MKRLRLFRLGISQGILLVVLGGSGWAQGGGAEDCAACHTDQSKKLGGTPHATLTCAGCHERHETYPHPERIARPDCASCHPDIAAEDRRGVHGLQRAQGNAAAPDCGMCHGEVHEIRNTDTLDFRRSIPETCGMCHDQVAREFAASVHGRALIERREREAPLCTDCHGEHSILPHKSKASPVHGSRLRETCGRCHADVRLGKRYGLPVDRITSFENSFHGLALRTGSQTVANCASCHGVHNILPSSDPKSTIYPANLAKTCGGCHPGAGTRFAITQIHWVEGRAEPAPVRWVRVLYQILIPLAIGLMILHNLGDWVRKVLRYRLLQARAAARGIVQAVPGMVRRGFPAFRMHRFERITHALLALSFLILVWTGFALKYPEEWWARPLVMSESRWPVRGVVHRVAAVVMMGAAGMHLISLFVNRRLREHWKAMIPVRSDLAEGFQNLAYNLGLRRRGPVIASHAYIEKVEYWSVLWGTVIMALTGILLWANNWALTVFPKVVLDVATAVHFYEALLASLAILVWHFYSVIFDPEVYPMDPAWLTGYSVKKLYRADEEHGAGEGPAGQRPPAHAEPAAPPALPEPKAGSAAD